MEENNMMKKLTALSLALVLLLSVCAGCGSKPASSAGSAGSEAGSDTSAPAHGEILIKLVLTVCFCVSVVSCLRVQR